MLFVFFVCVLSMINLRVVSERRALAPSPCASDDAASAGRSRAFFMLRRLRAMSSIPGHTQRTLKPMIDNNGGAFILS